MSKYRDPTTGEIIEVGNPELNPQLTQGKTQVPDTTPTGSITSSTLSQTSTPEFKSPQPTTPYDISALTEDNLAPVQIQATDLTKRIQQQRTDLTGESQFRAQQAEATGLNAEQQAQDDLAVQLRNLQRESQAIPIQLQQQATGRGITAGGLAPLQADKLRTNAIQALGISALMDASQNRLISAQRKLDRAVEEKYGKQKAELEANLANLQLIQSSPEYSKAEKAQALQTQLRQQAFGKQLDLLANQEKEKNDAVVKIVGFNPNIPSNVKQALLAAKDATEVAFVANSLGLNLQKPLTPEEKAQNEADLAYKKAQTAKIYADKKTPPGSESSSGGEFSPYKVEVATNGRNAVAGLKAIALESPGIFGKTAAAPIPDWLRSDAFRNYKAQLDYLKGNVIPAALTAMREASKTGGALGQVSDREGAWLGSSLGALEMNQSPEMIIKQLNEIDKHLAIWQNAVEKYGTNEPLPITAPDGTQVIITD